MDVSLDIYAIRSHDTKLAMETGKHDGEILRHSSALITYVRSLTVFITNT